MIFYSSKVRDNGEGDVLVIRDNVVMKRRVGRSQVKGVVIYVKIDDLNGTVKHDIDSTHGAKRCNVSEFDLVKSVDITYTRARKN